MKEKSINIIPSFERLRKLNSTEFSFADYVNFLSHVSESPYDTVNSFSQIFLPSFQLLDGWPINISLRYYERFQYILKDGLSENDAYYWSHLTDVGGIFQIDEADAHNIADNMCIGWNSKLKQIGVDHISFQKVVDEEVLIAPLIKNVQ